MSKLTRRFKKNKKNKSNKRGGNKSFKRSGGEPENERKGIVDIVEGKIANVADSVATTISDAGLKIIGLERINKSLEDEQEEQEEQENNNNNISKIVSGVGNAVDKTSAYIINNINGVLGSDGVNKTTQQAAEDTAEIIKRGAENFNEALNKPEVKAEVEKAIENLGELSSVFIDSAKEPFNKAVDVAAEATQKASSGAVSGAVKVGTDFLAAIPFFGAVVDLGKIVNDSSKAITAVVEAGSETVEATSDAITETTENFKEGLKDLEEKQKMGQQISDRTTESMDNFENPTAQITGGQKTKRRFSKIKSKSKRVRFAI